MQKNCIGLKYLVTAETLVSFGTQFDIEQGRNVW